MITFVGAGPGDPDLITVKGKARLEAADVVLFAGSLVPKAVLQWTRPDCECIDSASLDLEAQINVMAAAKAANKRCVRLHTGDPAIFGAIGEQMRKLDHLGISYEVVPGVSSFLAAAAAIKTELTLPEVSQTVIITRCAGRTPVPEGQDLASLAKHQATLVIFLSAGLFAETIAQLASSYPIETPVAVVQRASWPEQKIVRGTIADIAAKVAEAKIDRTALIIVGEILKNQGAFSKLYDAAFTHGYREGSDDSL